jgi:hypothetical protein
VAANKVATEEAEKARAARAELATVEHRVAEQTRRELAAAFDAERSRLAGELHAVKAAAELEIAEMRAQLEENHDVLQSALHKMSSHHAGGHYNHQQQQQRSASAVSQQPRQPFYQQAAALPQQPAAAASSVPRSTASTSMDPQQHYASQGRSASALSPFSFERQQQQQQQQNPPPRNNQHFFHQHQQQQQRSASAAAATQFHPASPNLTDFMRSQVFGGSASADRNVLLEGVDMGQDAETYGSSSSTPAPSHSPARQHVPLPQAQLTVAQQSYRKFTQKAAAAAAASSRKSDDTAGSSSPSQLQWPPRGAVRG